MFFAGGSFGLNLGGRAEIDRFAIIDTTDGMSHYTKEFHYNTVVHGGNVPSTYNTNNNYDQGIYSNKYNWSILFGSNYQLNKRVLLGIEAKIGLTNITPHNYWLWGNLTDNDARDGFITTQSYKFTVTYIFGKGVKSIID